MDTTRRKFFAGLGAALLCVPLLPGPIKKKALEWKRVDLTITIKTNEDGTVSIVPGDVVWAERPKS